MSKKFLKEILTIVLITMLSCVSLIFSFLYLDTFYEGFVFQNVYLVKFCVFVVVATLSIVTIILFGNKKEFVFKLFIILLAFFSAFTLVLYLLKITHILDKFDSVDAFRTYIANYGSYAWLLFILIQFLQVVVLPIPSFITVGAGVLLFGPFKAGIYSCFGIIVGSIVAFFIGRVFGYKVVKWLVGEKSLKKGLKLIKGKDKVILTFMMLFPFFPDDVLCFVAGITTMSTTFFILMIFVTRIASIFVSTYSMNNNLIPYNTWWGILIWAILFAIVIVLSIVIVKKSEKIEKFINKKIKRKNE